jgi:hypothetical protein
VIAVSVFGFGAVFMSTFPGTRVGSAAARHAQAIPRCGEPLQLHGPMQLQLWVGFSPKITPDSAPLRAHGRLTDCATMKKCR